MDRNRSPDEALYRLYTYMYAAVRAARTHHQHQATTALFARLPCLERLPCLFGHLAHPTVDHCPQVTLINNGDV